MVDFDTWTDNYIDLLNTLYIEILNIAFVKNINLHDNQQTFDDFCYMLYSNSKNLYLRNQQNFDYV